MLLLEDKKLSFAVNSMQLAFKAHRGFCLALMVFLPLEMIFVLSNNYYWGLHGDKFIHIITKPLPMVCIIAAAAFYVKLYGSNRFRKFLLAGFVLSLIADILLLGDEDEHFLSGLLFFLLAHVMYIVAFSIPPEKTDPRVPLRYNRATLFCFLSIIPAMLTKQMLADQRNPILIGAVIIYSVIIAVMGWRAAARIGYPTETFNSQFCALIGSLFFIASDSLLAFNRFYAPIPGEKIWVLSTYWIAQTLFALSLHRSSWVERTSSAIVNM